MSDPTHPVAQCFQPDVFSGHQVVVAGGTGGIGAAIAQAFGRLGADVVAAGLDTSGVTLDHVARVVDLDVTDQDSVRALFGGYESLGVLVNCAGITFGTREYEPAVFYRVLEVNLIGTMLTCLAARNALTRGQGSIVNVSSIGAFSGAARAPAHGASKAAIVQLTKSLAVSFAPDVRVDAIAPGWTRTPMTKEVHEDAEVDRQIVEHTPLRRWAEEDDICGPVMFLASPAARFVTGTTLPVAGGNSVA
jgi:NAD(P)-dependent dehydrogenase (short-subunit alcohol dehydrogenase family)